MGACSQRIMILLGSGFSKYFRINSGSVLFFLLLNKFLITNICWLENNWRGSRKVDS